MTTGRIKTTKVATTGSTLPEIGKIKIGEKKTNAQGKEYPTSLDYFRATGHFADNFKTVYGAKPNKLTIIFITDDVAEVCNERYECWTDGKRWGWGDGELFTVYDMGTKSYVDNIPADDQRVKKLKWETVLTLRFVLLDMKGIMGYWTFTTKAIKGSIPSIVKAFDWVKEKAQTIIGFPFVLSVEKVTGKNPGDVKNYPQIKLVPNFSQESMEKVAAYLEDGGNLNKITTKFIQAAEQGISEASKQLSPPPAVVVDSSPELFPKEEAGK